MEQGRRPGGARPARHGAFFIAACIGGTLGGCGGGDDAGAAAAAGMLALADCEAKPAGRVSHYLNSARPRHEWVAAQFDGQPVVARREYDRGGTLILASYYRDDAAARTSTLVGREWYDYTGPLLQRVRYSGTTLSLALEPGQSQTVQYAWQVLVPLGDPGGSGSMTLRYDGPEMVSLPQGGLQACRTTLSIRDASGNPLSTETSYSAPGAQLVKSYQRVLDPSSSDVGQTYLLELGSTDAALDFVPPTAGGTPSLASCSALAPGLDLVYSASTVNEASSARRATLTATLQGNSSLAMQRRHVETLELRSTFHYDPDVGFLRPLGVENVDGASGALFSGRPDLRTTALGASVDYAETTTAYPTNASVVANDRFSFLGHERLNTPAGTLDACKVRFSYGVGVVETYWLVPGRSFVRLETTRPASGGGTLTTSREQLVP